MSILVALLALSLLIIIHELGHFLAAKAAGIKVLEFSLFMGPKLFSVTRGETMYSLRLIPMGGYVKMEGEEESSSDPRAYGNQPVGKKAMVVSAGNILTAFVFAVIFLTPTGFYTNKITEIADDSPLKQAGAEVGDRLVSYGGKRFFDIAADMNIFMYGEDGREKEVVYFDADENQKVTKVIAPGRTATRIRLGFTAKLVGNEASNIIDMV